MIALDCEGFIELSGVKSLVDGISLLQIHTVAWATRGNANNIRLDKEEMGVEERVDNELIFQLDP